MRKNTTPISAGERAKMVAERRAGATVSAISRKYRRNYYTTRWVTGGAPKPANAAKVRAASAAMVQARKETPSDLISALCRELAARAPTIRRFTVDLAERRAVMELVTQVTVEVLP